MMSLLPSIKFIGYSPLMLAVEEDCEPALIDFLIAKGISLTETDQLRGCVDPPLAPMTSS